MDQEDNISRKLVRVLQRGSKQSKRIGKNSLEKELSEQRKKIKIFAKEVGKELLEVSNEDFKNGETPLWVEKLIEHDSNPLDNLSDKEFAKYLGLTLKDIDRARRKFPSYALAVAYRRQKYMYDCGNFFMKALVERIKEKSDICLKMGLEMTGLYIPQTKVIEEIDPGIKREKIKALLNSFGKDELVQNYVKEIKIENESKP